MRERERLERKERKRKKEERKKGRKGGGERRQKRGRKKIGDRIIQHETIIRHVILPLKTGNFSKTCIIISREYSNLWKT